MHVGDGAHDTLVTGCASPAAASQLFPSTQRYTFIPAFVETCGYLVEPMDRYLSALRDRHGPWFRTCSCHVGGRRTWLGARFAEMLYSP